MKLVFLTLITCLIFSTVLNASGILVEATAKIYSGNITHAKKKALNNVAYEAVKKSVESLIALKTINKNYEVIKNQIYRFSKKFIIDYNVISEEKNLDKKFFKVSVIAKVNNEKIKVILKDLRIINKKKNRKKLLVILDSNDPNTLTLESPAATLAFESAIEAFADHGFWTFSKKTNKHIYSLIENEKIVGRPLDSLISLALIFNAEILVLMRMTVEQSDKPYGSSYKINTKINFSAFDTLTGKQISETNVESYEMSKNILNKIELSNLLTKTSKHVAMANALRSANQIISYYKKKEFLGQDYSLIFNGFSPSQESLIIEYLESNSAFQNLSELKNNLGYLELELFSQKRKSVLRRKIVSELLEHKIEVAIKSLAGNRLIFVNPDPKEKDNISDNSTKIFLKDNFINPIINKIIVFTKSYTKNIHHSIFVTKN